jgi:hypothetical protein
MTDADLYRCAADQLAATISALDGAAITEPVDECDQPAEHEVIVIRAPSVRHGIELTTWVCDAHHRLISLTPDYVRSIKLRPPAADTTYCAICLQRFPTFADCGEHMKALHGDS